MASEFLQRVTCDICGEVKEGERWDIEHEFAHASYYDMTKDVDRFSVSAHIHNTDIDICRKCLEKILSMRKR